MNGLRESIMKRITIIGMLLFGATIVSGCKKVADEKKSDVEPGQIIFYSVPAVKNLTVEFSSSAAPIDIYVVADKDAEKAKADLQNSKEPASPLAVQKASSGTITVNNSTKTEMTILLTSMKKTTVTVKINGS